MSGNDKAEKPEHEKDRLDPSHVGVGGHVKTEAELLKRDSTKLYIR